MGTRIVRVRGGSKEDVLNKKFNIFVAISLGNKWFTKENIKEYIFWALKNTRNKVLVLIADRIHAINYEVKNKQTPELSLKRALREGGKKVILVEEIIKNLSQNEREKIGVVRWGDLEILDKHKELKEFFHKKFNDDRNFKEAVLDIVENTISLKLDASKTRELSEYVLNELPEVLASFEYKGDVYNCYPYPTNTEIAKFVERIQKREIFSEIYDNFKFENMVCVQLEVI